MRVVVAEDQIMLRVGLVSLLEAVGHEVVEQVGTGPELSRVLGNWRADVAIVDIRLPPSHTDEGLRAVLAARRVQPALPVLLFSQYVEQLYVRELLADQAGGIGYLLKDRVSHPRQFMDALDQVAAGGTVLDPTVVSALINRVERGGPVGTLTQRERQVLDLMAQGRSNTAIGYEMHISESATTKHISNVFTKLGLHPSLDDNRRVLAVLAYLNER
ncbi:response regulator transcription factor [Micromonospora ureilytica]|uniref:response regulator transcription factor n=1 Tax=Micromonospora ureilytica TaxID=709868 RepID=UPI0034031F44